MKMGPCTAACVSHPCNQITPTDSLTDSNKSFIAMRITRLVAIGVLNFNHQSISTEIIHEDNLSTPCSKNGCSNVISDIDT